MRTKPARDAAGALLLAVGLSLTDVAWAQETIEPNLVITPREQSAPPGIQLQLEVFVNGEPRQLVSPFTQRQDGVLASAPEELDEIGLVVPPVLASQAEVALTQLDGVTYVYDQRLQTIDIAARPRALKSFVVVGGAELEPAAPESPPLGAVVNYTLLASAEDAADGARFDGFSGAFDGRVFGRFGLVENSFIGNARSGDSDAVRLDTRYVRDDPTGVRTFIAGDLITGGFSWTRPVRLGGLQFRRSFELRPDLVTMPLPVLSGTAEAPSTLELYINSIRALSADVPPGPFEIAHPPVVHGGGLATLILRDALGREVVTTTPFYTSPELLAPGLTDYSISLGFPRRNYGSRSNDYDSRLAASASIRRGVSHGLTLKAHAETAGSLVSIGGGAVFTLGNLAIASAAAGVSRTEHDEGALVDLVLESHNEDFSITARTRRTFGTYEDIASWTAVRPHEFAGNRRIFGQPREADQITVSAPLPWRGGHAGASYIESKFADDHSRLLSLSLTQQLGRASLFASAFHDFEEEDEESTTVFVGLSLPLGGDVSGFSGLTHRQRRTSAYVEATKHEDSEPGSWGWNVRAAAGERNEAEATIRYGARVARFEAGVLHTQDRTYGHAIIEGAVTALREDVHFSRRIDSAFGLVEVGAPGVTILHENRPVGRTNERGQILVPHLTPFVRNTVALDPTNLPLNAQVPTTTSDVTPSRRVAAFVDLRIEETAAALVSFVDVSGEPIALGSQLIMANSDSVLVGHDGQAWLTGLRPRNRVTIIAPNGVACDAEFEFTQDPDRQVQIRGVACAPQ